MRRVIGLITTTTLLLLCSAVAWGADAAAGKAVFAAKCKSCHGADGEGNAAVAKMLKADIKPLSATTADVKQVVTNGQGKMKPVASVTGSDLDNVVAFVKSLKK